MEPVGNIGQVYGAIQKAKTGASGFITNFFPVQRKLQGWIDHGDFFCESDESAALFFRKDRDFQHFYFCAANAAALQERMATSIVLKRERVVTDLVGAEAALTDLLALLKAGGFRQLTRLCRMTRTTPVEAQQSSPSDSQIVCATQADCRAVLDLLERSFNRYGEQLPMLYELETAVADGQILVAKHEGAIAGMLFFETQGFTSTIRYWLVDGRFRSFRFGSALMRRYFETQSAVRRFVLWVIADNESVIQKYRHYGFAPEGLVDYALANQMVPV